VNWIIKVLRGFGLFWWDFLVGDTPEIFVMTVAAVGLTYLVSERWHQPHAAMALLPALAIGALAWSVQRARAAWRRKD
jgi:hypothetical protein